MTKCLRSSTPSRLVVVGGAYAGYATLRETLEDKTLAGVVDVVGLVWDDPKNPVSKASKRTWQLLDTEELPLRVERLAAENDIPTYSGDLRDKRFEETFVTEWRPDMVVCAFFGQKVPLVYREVPKLGAINTHPCPDYPFDVWPTPFGGTLPITRMVAAGYDTLYWAAHFMTDEYDAGPIVACSPKLTIDVDDPPSLLHEKQAVHIGRFVADVIAVLTGARRPLDTLPPRGYADFGPNTDVESIQLLNPIQSPLFDQSLRKEGATCKHSSGP